MAIADDVATIMAGWNEGMLARGEVGSRITDLLTPTNIDEVVAATPDEWRDDLMERLRDLGSDGELITISGGIYTYEVESDPVRRAGMKAEVERAEAERKARVEQEIRPAVRVWLRGQPPGGKR